MAYGVLYVTKPIRVYTLPGCEHCEELKKKLKELGVEFEERVFDVEAQTEFIMRNVFGNPPILEVGETAYAYEDLFDGDEIFEDRVREVIRGAEGRG